MDAKPSHAVILQNLQKKMTIYYNAYQSGDLTESEYLYHIKILDKQIDTIELSILKEYVVCLGSSSVSFHEPESLKA